MLAQRPAVDAGQSRARCCPTMSQRQGMREGAGIAGGIAGMTVVFLTLLPFLLVVVLFTFFTIYGMTKGTRFEASTLNLAIWFTGVAVAVATLLLLLFGGIALIGRSLDPKKRKKDRG
jgi:hypothetical protein